MKRCAWGRRILRTAVGSAALAVASAVAAEPADRDAQVADAARNPEAHERAELRAIRTLQKTTLKELALAPDVARRINDLFDDHHERVKEILRTQDESRAGNERRMNELREELERVKGERDIEGVRRIRSEMRNLDSGRVAIRRAGIKFDKEVAKVLPETLVERYRQLSSRYRHRSGPAQRTGQGIGSVHRILRKIDLTDAQREMIAKITSETAAAYAEARNDPDRRNRAATEFRSKVMAELTGEQRDRFIELEQAEPATRLPPPARQPSDPKD